MYSFLADRPSGASQGPSHGPARSSGGGSGKGAMVKSPPREPHATKRSCGTSLADALSGQPPPKKTRTEPKAAIGAKKGSSSSGLGTGSVFESDMEHVKQHRREDSKQAERCVRCIFASHPRSFEASARLPRKSGGSATWLEPRPTHMGGSWALGCRICAWYSATLPAKGCSIHGGLQQKVGIKRKHRKLDAKDPALRARSQVRFSKFAMFKWSATGTARKKNSRTATIARLIEQHGNSAAHEVAYRAMLQKEDACEIRPLAEPEPQAAANPLARKTFKGRVPKPLDWLDSFVESSNLVSWSKQARMHTQKSGQASGEPSAPEPEVVRHIWDPPAQQAEGQPLAASQAGRRSLAGPRETGNGLRKRRRRQTRIMAEVVRRRHRRILGKAKFCTLALDEAQGRKLVHFRCDYHKAPWHYQGTLGIFKMGAQTVEEGEGDHAKKAVKRLDEFITKFSTPLRKASLGTTCDNEFREHFLKIVTTISADGGAAERRAIYLAGAWGSPFNWAS